MNSTNDNIPILSVIVPMYNASSTIERCLMFLLNQSLASIEIICVDDCSTDRTPEIVHGYVKKYPEKIKYAKTNAQTGPGGARNLGISIATGMYIGFVDSDDWIDSSLYDTVISAIELHDADIAIFGVKDECGNYLCSRIRYMYPELSVIDNDFALKLLARTYCNNIYISPMVCQKIYKRSFIEKNALRFAEKSFSEDDYFSFCCFLCESKIITVPNVYYHYYQRASSITHTFSKKHIDDLVILLSQIRNRLCAAASWEEHQDDYYAFCSKCIRSNLNMLFDSEQSIKAQKKYLSYLINELQSHFTVDEWVQYLDITTIRRILLF